MSDKILCKECDDSKLLPGGQFATGWVTCHHCPKKDMSGTELRIAVLEDENAHWSRRVAALEDELQEVKKQNDRLANLEVSKANCCWDNEKEVLRIRTGLLKLAHRTALDGHPCWCPHGMPNNLVRVHAHVPYCEKMRDLLKDPS